MHSSKTTERGEGSSMQRGVRRIQEQWVGHQLVLSQTAPNVNHVKPSKSVWYLDPPQGLCHLSLPPLPLGAVQLLVW